MCSLAEKDGRICAVTAAMAEGTGLAEFANKYPNAFLMSELPSSMLLPFQADLPKTD